MASIVNYVADGATNQFQIPFTYINQSDVVVTVNGTAPTFTFLNSTTINITATPASGAKVIISRATPLNPLVDFADGSTLFEADLDLAHQQNRLIAEESRDRADSAIATINANIDNIDTVAEIAGNVNIVAGNTTNVNSVAANMAEVLTADDNAATATTKANEASASASTASAQATISTTKAGESSTSAAEALASKNAASASESASSTSETNAANSATSSSNSASASASSASSANSSQIVATTKAAEAVVSANNSAVSATNSANSATTAITKANEASASQIAASNSETNALSSKNAAASSATNAATSETNSASSATASANSAATATTKANEAATSATSSANSATASANSATAAAASAASITGAETNAANSATAAASSATAASASKDAALAALDSFDDRYLGVKSSNPSVDNDGNALVAGSLYFNSTDDTMKVYEGSTWVAAYASLSGAVLQTGSAMTGDLSFGDNDKAIFGNSSDLQIYHDGVSSYIDDAGTGNLKIRASNMELLDASGNDYITMVDGGSGGTVRIKHLGSTVLTTTSTGIDVTGTVSATDVSMPDDGILSLGTSDELTLKHHNSGYSHLTNTTGTLFIDSDSVTFRDDDGSPTNVLINQSGIDVNGTVTSDGLTVDGDGKITTSSGIGLQLHNSSSNQSYLQFTNSATGESSANGLQIGIDGSEEGLIWHYKNEPIKFATNNTERMRIDSSGNVGIGTSSTDNKVNIQESALAGRGASNGNTSMTLEHATDTGIQFFSAGQTQLRFGDAASTGAGSIIYEHATDKLRLNTGSLTTFEDGGVERMRIDSSGNVGIGTSSGLSGSSASTALRIGNQINIHEYDDGGNPVQMNINQNIDPNENYITTDHAARYQMRDGVHKWFSVGSGTAGTASGIGSGEKMRIDSSGNLLVGKSSSSSSVAGFMVEPDGDTYITAEGAEGRVLYANRLTSDGDIMQFAKDGTTVGSISSNNATNLQINSQGGTFAIKTINTERYSFDQEQIYPWNNGECNLGLSYRRFDVVYAATGSINTSDQTQKQDIESLTATEMLVGKRLSALFKTFRWKNRVAEKGDSARTHTGIMAQEVQAAFTAEGLDASNYALFCSDTWWEHDVEVPAVEAVAEVTDEDGNVTTEAVEAVDAYTRTDEYKTEDEAPEGAISKTLLGIRYPELLSFVAAYNEQRFASIEARLTALEG